MRIKIYQFLSYNLLIILSYLFLIFAILVLSWLQLFNRDTRNTLLLLFISTEIIYTILLNCSLDCSNLTYLWLCCKIKLPVKTIKGILEPLRTVELSNGQIVKVEWFCENSKELNAKCKYSKIKVNQRWVECLLFCKEDQETINAFRQTVGHELSHMNIEAKLIAFGKSKKLCNWIVEIKCDYMGVVKALKGSKKVGINVLKYIEKQHRTPDMDSYTHPSWKRRIDYIGIGKFDRKLIEQVALDVGCKNEKHISDLAEFYEEMKLT